MTYYPDGIPQDPTALVGGDSCQPGYKTNNPSTPTSCVDYTIASGYNLYCNAYRGLLISIVNKLINAYEAARNAMLTVHATVLENFTGLTTDDGILLIATEAKTLLEDSVDVYNVATAAAINTYNTDMVHFAACISEARDCKKYNWSITGTGPMGAGCPAASDSQNNTPKYVGHFIGYTVIQMQIDRNSLAGDIWEKILVIAGLGNVVSDAQAILAKDELIVDLTDTVTKLKADIIALSDDCTQAQHDAIVDEYNNARIALVSAFSDYIGGTGQLSANIINALNALVPYFGQYLVTLVESYQDSGGGVSPGVKTQINQEVQAVIDAQGADVTAFLALPANQCGGGTPPPTGEWETDSAALRTVLENSVNAAFSDASQTIDGISVQYRAQVDGLKPVLDSYMLSTQFTKFLYTTAVITFLQNVNAAAEATLDSAYGTIEPTTLDQIATVVETFNTKRDNATTVFANAITSLANAQNVATDIVQAFMDASNIWVDAVTNTFSLWLDSRKSTLADYYNDFRTDMSNKISYFLNSMPIIQYNGYKTFENFTVGSTATATLGMTNIGKVSWYGWLGLKFRRSDGTFLTFNSEPTSSFQVQGGTSLNIPINAFLGSTFNLNETLTVYLICNTYKRSVPVWVP